MKHPKLTSTLFGLLVIGIGTGYMGNVLLGWGFTLLFDGSWTLLLILPAFFHIINRGLRLLNSIVLATGTILLGSYYVPLSRENMCYLLLSTVIILLGIGIIVSAFYKPKVPKEASFPSSPQTTREDHDAPRYFAYLSTIHRENRSANFKGCRIESFMGSAVVDLAQAVIRDNIQIHLSASMGSICCRLPKGVRLVVKSSPFFGNVHTRTEDAALPPDAPTVTVTARTFCGSISLP